MSSKYQDTREIEILRKFASTCPLAIDMASIEKRKPPQPDLSCVLEDGKEVAFELVEIIDEALARRTFGSYHLGKAFYKIFEEFPSNKKARFKKKYGNALIYVAFKDTVVANRRRRSMATIFEFLSCLDDNADGKYAFSSQETLGKTVDWVNISRGAFVGPCFNVRAAGFFEDPVCERIKDKFTKPYHVNSEFHLLAYYELQPELPEHSWLPQVKDFLEASLDCSMFDRIWVYSFTQDKILHVYPPY